MIDWKKKSAMAVVAGGLFGGAAQAQPLGNNLVANPSFELPGTGTVASWTGTALTTYAYSQGYTSTIVPPSAGLLYLEGPPALTGTTTQTIDMVAAGFPAAILDSGLLYNLSAYFSTYTDTNDNTAITARFLNAGTGQIGASSAIGGEAFVNSLPVGNNNAGMPGFNDWGQDQTSGTLPVGSRFVVIDILHTRLAGTNLDGYTDVVNFQLNPIPEPGTLLLTAFGGAALVRRWRRRGDEAKQ